MVRAKVRVKVRVRVRFGAHLGYEFSRSCYLFHFGSDVADKEKSLYNVIFGLHLIYQISHNSFISVS